MLGSSWCTVVAEYTPIAAPMAAASQAGNMEATFPGAAARLAGTSDRTAAGAGVTKGKSGSLGGHVGQGGFGQLAASSVSLFTQG
jgi:hypothetical protein